MPLPPAESAESGPAERQSGKRASEASRRLSRKRLRHASSSHRRKVKVRLSLCRPLLVNLLRSGAWRLCRNQVSIVRVRARARLTKIKRASVGTGHMQVTGEERRKSGISVPETLCPGVAGGTKGRKWPGSDPTLSGLRPLTRRFAQPSRAHHRPQFRGIEPCSLASCVRAVTVLPSDFSCDGKSAKPWSGASYAFRKLHHLVRSLVSSDGPVERIAGSTGAASRGCDSETDSRRTKALRLVSTPLRSYVSAR